MQEKLVDKLVEECTKSIDRVEVASENAHKNKCSSCTLYIILFSIIFTICIGIATYFILIGILKMMMLVLCLIPVLKQQSFLIYAA